MRVQMLTHIGGLRNGEPWPLAGETVDLPDGEAKKLIANKYAQEAPSEADTTEPDEADAPESGDGGGSDEGTEAAQEEAAPVAKKAPAKRAAKKTAPKADSDD